MSDQNNGDLTDKEKIDREAWHEEVRFLKKQQWAVATAGVVLFGGFRSEVSSAQGVNVLRYAMMSRRSSAFGTLMTIFVP